MSTELGQIQIQIQIHSNSMSEVASIFMGVMMDALITLMEQGGDMAEAFSKDPVGYQDFLNENLLPVVYRRANQGQE